MGPVDIIGITDESSYFVVTSGCPADHVGGFKNGGLKRMLSECRSWLVGINVTNYVCYICMYIIVQASFLNGLKVENLHLITSEVCIRYTPN